MTEVMRKGWRRNCSSRRSGGRKAARVTSDVAVNWRLLSACVRSNWGRSPLVLRTFEAPESRELCRTRVRPGWRIAVDLATLASTIWVPYHGVFVPLCQHAHAATTSKTAASHTSQPCLYMQFVPGAFYSACSIELYGR